VQSIVTLAKEGRRVPGGHLAVAGVQIVRRDQKGMRAAISLSSEARPLGPTAAWAW